MENISIGGRPMPGFALGEPVGVGQDGVASSKYAALMTGAATGLLVYVLQAPVWGAVLAGAAAAVVTKASIDRAAA
jgi:hypothetical protein